MSRFTSNLCACVGACFFPNSKVVSQDRAERDGGVRRYRLCLAVLTFPPTFTDPDFVLIP